MKVAISSVGKDENSKVSMAGGRAPYYLIFEDRKLVKVMSNPFRVGGGGAGFAVGSILQFYIPLVLIYSFLNFIVFPIVPVISQNIAFEPISLIPTIVFNTMLTLTILEFAGGR